MCFANPGVSFGQRCNRSVTDGAGSRLIFLADRHEAFMLQGGDVGPGLSQHLSDALSADAVLLADLLVGQVFLGPQSNELGGAPGVLWTAVLPASLSWCASCSP
jgi:hypothetical protein